MQKTEAERLAISRTLLTPSSSLGPLATPKKVWRHLVDGDVLLVNRQPTLHKPGMMAHTAVVLPDPAAQTIRMHYANCNT
jgi:DNA-directed RNA polymerase I subunit RPA1